MKIICTKSNLAKGVGIVSKAVPSKTTMPILECILIDATASMIKLTANDMELGIETIIEGDIVQPGMIALDAKIFLKLSENFLTVKSLSQRMIMIRRLLPVKSEVSNCRKVRKRFCLPPYIEKTSPFSFTVYTKKSDSSDDLFDCRYREQ